MSDPTTNSLAIEVAEIRSEVRQIARAIDKIGVAIDKLAAIEARLALLASVEDEQHKLEMQVRAIETQLAQARGWLGAIALAWPVALKYFGF